MKIIIKRLTCILSALLLAIMVCFQSIPFQALSAKAASNYTSALVDLEKNENFRITDYPTDLSDNSLEVITIAEGSNAQLYVYVYQPCAARFKYVATSINISTDYEKLSFVNYKLRLVNQTGVFQKYVVEGIIIVFGGIRQYNISSIFRPYDSTVDDKLSDTNDNLIDETVFEVGKLYTFETKDDVTTMKVEDVETIKVEDKFVGFVRYQSPFNGLMGFTNYYDSHFVAFSTDKRIDKLLEADVYYEYQEYHYEQREFIKIRDELTDPEKKYVYLTDEQKGNYTEDNLFWETEYEWYRISTVEDFIKTEDRENVYSVGFILEAHEQSKISEEGLQALAGKEWVLRFTETNYHKELTSARTKFDFALISNVSILRLKFETDGKIYNLGVVDNKQTGSFNPINDSNFGVELSDSVKDIFKLLALILVLLLGVFLFRIIRPIVSVVGTVVTAPFKGIKSLTKRKKKRK